jgi:hypothetical protein
MLEYSNHAPAKPKPWRSKGTMPAITKTYTEKASYNPSMDTKNETIEATQNTLQLVTYTLKSDRLSGHVGKVRESGAAIASNSPTCPESASDLDIIS